MKFSILRLNIDGELPTVNIFRRLQSTGNTLHRREPYLYKIEHGLIEDRFYWMYFLYEVESLYSEAVVDTSDDSDIKNPREKNQVELRDQLFTCYDLKTHRLYISDVQKKAAVTDYISHSLQVKVDTKATIRSLEEFCAANSFLKSISFVQTSVIDNMVPDSIFTKVHSVYGLDIPDKFKIKFDYVKSPISVIANALPIIKSNYDNLRISEVMIVGIDDGGFENAFDYTKIISSIELDIKRSENYLYNAEEVKATLLSNIRGKNGKT